MDPQACLEAMFEAEYNSPDDYNGYKSSLTAWLEGGGFGPKVELLDGRKATMIRLTWSNGCTIRFRNGRKKTVRLHQIGRVGWSDL